MPVPQAIFTVSELHVCGLAALTYEIKAYETRFCGALARYYEQNPRRIAII